MTMYFICEGLLLEAIKDWLKEKEVVPICIPWLFKAEFKAEFYLKGTIISQDLKKYSHRHWKFVKHVKEGLLKIACKTTGGMEPWKMRASEKEMVPYWERIWEVQANPQMLVLQKGNI